MGDNEADNPSLRPKRRRETEAAEPSSSHSGDNESNAPLLRPKRRRDTELAGESSACHSADSVEVKKRKQTEHGVQSVNQ